MNSKSSTHLRGLRAAIVDRGQSPGATRLCHGGAVDVRQVAARPRGLSEQVEELDGAFAAVQTWAARVAAMPSTNGREHGMLVRAQANVMHLRGDFEREVDARLAQAAVARCFGRQAWARASESNAILTLVKLGRHAETVERARALLRRIDAAGVEENPYGRGCCEA